MTSAHHCKLTDNDRPSPELWIDEVQHKSVKFLLKNCKTEWGEEVFLCGNWNNWNEGTAEKMASNNSNSNEWSGELLLPVGFQMEYKYFLKQNSAIKWEKIQNRKLTINKDSSTLIIDTLKDWE